MATLNSVHLIGRLGQDPQSRSINPDSKVINISLATTSFSKNADGSKSECRNPHRTEWHRLVIWNKTADVVERYCRKGSQIFIDGSLQTREWQTKEGEKRQTTEILVRSVQLLDPPPDRQNQRPEHNSYTPQNDTQHNYPPPPGQPVTEDYGPEDDIPF